MAKNQSLSKIYERGMYIQDVGRDETMSVEIKGTKS